MPSRNIQEASGKGGWAYQMALEVICAMKRWSCCRCFILGVVYSLPTYRDASSSRILLKLESEGPVIALRNKARQRIARLATGVDFPPHPVMKRH